MTQRLSQLLVLCSVIFHRAASFRVLQTTDGTACADTNIMLARTQISCDQLFSNGYSCFTDMGALDADLAGHRVDEYCPVSCEACRPDRPAPQYTPSPPPSPPSRPPPQAPDAPTEPCSGAQRLAMAAAASQQQEIADGLAQKASTGVNVCSVNALGDLSSSHCPSQQTTSRVIPDSCPAFCAASFSPWWDACGSQPLITMLDVSLGNALSGFSQLCAQELNMIEVTCGRAAPAPPPAPPTAPSPPPPAAPSPPVVCADHLNPPCEQVLSMGYPCMQDMASFGVTGQIRDYCPVSCHVCEEGANRMSAFLSQWYGWLGDCAELCGSLPCREYTSF
eukprot:SAG31_NODE_5932_length_2252_cov_1.149094_1_plen_334_part_01